MIYKIIVDKQPMTNPSADKKEYEIDIAPLYFKHDVYDSLVITHDEDYVMRRLELQDYNVLVELDPPVKEPLTDINIELFEGENYIYLYDMVGNKIVAQYLVKNEFNELYVLETEMHSAIRQSANEIELIVGGQVTTLDGAVQDINGELSLKVDKNDNDQIVSMINASADEIYLTSNRLVIDSTNFKLSDAGNITATGGTVGGFTLGSTQFSSSFSGLYDYDYYDLRAAMCCVMDWLYTTSAMLKVLDVDNSGEITSADYTKIVNILRGITTNTKNVSGVLNINTKDPKNCISIFTDGNQVLSLGTEGIKTNILNTENIMCCYQQGLDQNSFAGIIMNGHTGQIKCVQDGEYNNGVTIKPYEIEVQKPTQSGTIIRSEEIITPVVHQTSLESEKKNFEKLQSGLDIIKDIDIYKYNMKHEQDDTKKHIGFVIGDNYKYSKEVTSNNNDGVDIYSFVAVCCKAIQEQQEEIQELKARIEKLEKGDK